LPHHQLPPGVSILPSALFTRPKADTSGAVECVLGEITSQATTLGNYLNKHPDLFHLALKKGLHGIYGYM
jgi:hypothetical protein